MLNVPHHRIVIQKIGNTATDLIDINHFLFRQGYLVSRCIPCGLIGVAGAGKTTQGHRLPALFPIDQVIDKF